jgi:hypothetical protein
MRTRPSAQNPRRTGRHAGFTARLAGTELDLLDLLGRLWPGLVPTPVPVPVQVPSPRSPRNGSRRR